MEGLSFWLTFQIVVMLLAVIFAGIRILLPPALWHASQKNCLLIGILCVSVSPLLPDYHQVEVWSHGSVKNKAPAVTVKLKHQQIAAFKPPTQLPLAVFPWHTVPYLLSLLGLIGLGRRYRQLFALSQRCTRYKTIGRTSVMILPADVHCPLAWRTVTKKFVALPPLDQVSYTNWQLSLKHELQHHRQGDTWAAHLMALLTSLFWFNPAIHMLARWFSESQEFLCDYQLVGHRRVNAKEYGRCLVQFALHQRQHPPVHLGLAGTTGLGCSEGRSHKSSQIYRRVKIMMSQHYQPKGLGGRRQIWMSGVCCAALLFCAALVSQAAVSDRRVTTEQARVWVQEIQAKTNFPVELNEQVLAQLNYFVGTERGRRFMQQSLARMSSFLPTIEQHLEFYRMPDELLAVPVVESGYVNRLQDDNPTHGAGIWMFIATTARRFGLRVNEERDDRLDVNLESDAAMRYLGTNFLRFKDWRLALLGYYAGENAVQRGIDTLQTRDPWELTAAGYGGDGSYLAQIMATVIILKNPTLIND